jgi:ribose transport system substrate-binding protein
MTVRNRITIAAVGLASLSLLIAGCSSSSKSSSGSSTGASSSGSSASAGSKYPDLDSVVAKLTQRPTTIGITEAVKQPIPSGKTIAFIQCGAPICVSLGKDLSAAAAKVNWKVNPIDAGLTAESIKAAWAQAVTTKPDAVVGSGNPRSLFNPELAALQAAKIPVIDLTTTDPATNGITQVYGGVDDWGPVGKNIADYMLVNSGGSAVKELSVTVSSYPNLGLVSGSIKSEITSKCSECSAAVLDVPGTSIGSDLPTRVTSYLSAHPDINWVYVGFDDMVTGLPAALQSAGLGKVKLATLSVNTTMAGYISNGQSLVMATGFDVTEMMWRSVDYLARLFTNSSVTPNTSATLPMWYVNKSNLPSTTENFPYVADYQAQYKKLWGVTS